MFAISSGHTKTIPLCNQMEHIISESLRMENSLSRSSFCSYHCSKSICVHDRELIWDVDVSRHFFLFCTVERLGSEVPR